MDSLNEYNIVENGMTDMINKIVKILQEDEVLLRLLYYPPMTSKRPDPLDPSLPDIKDSKDWWKIVDDRIKTVSKTSDLDAADICRIIITQDRRRSTFGNYLLASQWINISIITHENFEADNRIARISDRVNHLLVNEHVGAMVPLKYVKGDPRVAPRFYFRYDHIYEYMTVGK